MLWKKGKKHCLETLFAYGGVILKEKNNIRERKNTSPVEIYLILLFSGSADPWMGKQEEGMKECKKKEGGGGIFHFYIYMNDGQNKKMEKVAKRMSPAEIESAANPWKGFMLPLHHEPYA